MGPLPKNLPLNVIFRDRDLRESLNLNFSSFPLFGNNVELVKTLKKNQYRKKVSRGLGNVLMGNAPLTQFSSGAYFEILVEALEDNLEYDSDGNCEILDGLTIGIAVVESNSNSSSGSSGNSSSGKSLADSVRKASLIDDLASFFAVGLDGVVIGSGDEAWKKTEIEQFNRPGFWEAVLGADSLGRPGWNPATSLQVGDTLGLLITDYVQGHYAVVKNGKRVYENKIPVGINPKSGAIYSYYPVIDLFGIVKAISVCTATECEEVYGLKGP